MRHRLINSFYKKVSVHKIRNNLKNKNIILLNILLKKLIKQLFNKIGRILILMTLFLKVAKNLKDQKGEKIFMLMLLLH